MPSPLLASINTELLTYGDKVLTVACDEPEGQIDRSVYKFVFTPDNLRAFWLRSRQFKTLFSEEIRSDYRKFMDLLLRQIGSEIEATGLFYMVDDLLGMFYATDMKPGLDAIVHYSFFDGRHHGRVDLCKQLIRYFFKTYGFQRLTVQLPLYATPKTHNFVNKSLGFRREGRMRKAARFDNELFDVMLYGILRSEALGNGVQ